MIIGWSVTKFMFLEEQKSKMSANIGQSKIKLTFVGKYVKNIKMYFSETMELFEG